jgi:hypothetical protein
MKDLLPLCPCCNDDESGSERWIPGLDGLVVAIPVLRMLVFPRGISTAPLNVSVRVGGSRLSRRITCHSHCQRFRWSELGTVKQSVRAQDGREHYRLP